MSQNGNDLIGSQLLEQCIEQHDAFDPADAGKIGVGMAAATGRIHLKYAADLQPRLLHDPGDALFQLRLSKGLKFEKQRLDHIRRDVHQKEAEQGEKAPHP